MASRYSGAKRYPDESSDTAVHSNIIIGVNLIDVMSSKVMSNMTIRIKGGEIVSISKAKNVDMQESGYSSIDCTGLYMFPGLIDCEFI